MKPPKKSGKPFPKAKGGKPFGGKPPPPFAAETPPPPPHKPSGAEKRLKGKQF